MNLINKFFINKKIHKLKYTIPVIDIGEKINNVKSIVVLYSTDIFDFILLLSFYEALHNRYPDANIKIMFLHYYKLAYDIIGANAFNVTLPKPIKFNELTLYSKFKNCDMYIDISNIEYQYSIMIKRYLRPKIAISYHNDNLKNDFNVLVYAKTPNNILKSIGIKIPEITLCDMLKKETYKTDKIYDNILLGNSRQIRRKKQLFMKENIKTLHLSNPENEIDIKTIQLCIKAKNIYYDTKYRSLYTFIKKLKHDSIN